MASSIDWGTLALGALVGVGCRKQIRSCGRVAAKTVASLAGVAAATAADLAASAQSPEEKAAEAWQQRVDQNLQQQNGQSGNGQSTQNG